LGLFLSWGKIDQVERRLKPDSEHSWTAEVCAIVRLSISLLNYMLKLVVDGSVVATRESTSVRCYTSGHGHGWGEFCAMECLSALDNLVVNVSPTINS
jgi:hypothetical protein